MITIVSLLCGRYYCLEGYFESLKRLDYPKDKIKVKILINTDDEMFIKLVNVLINEIKKDYIEIEVVVESEIEPSNLAYREKDELSGEMHADNIAKLYNIAFKNINTEYVFSLEDDEFCPSNALSNLMKVMEDPEVAYVTGVAFCRHNGTMFLHDLKGKRVFPEGDDCNEVTLRPVPVKKFWGVREIGMGGLGCTLVRMSDLKALPQPIFKHKSNLIGAMGCDLVLCVELRELLKKKVMVDFDIRVLHMDSKGRVH